MKYGGISKILIVVSATLLAAAALIGPQPALAAPPDLVQIRAVEPARLLDTRPGEKTIDGVSAGVGRASAGSTVTLKVAGRGGVPADASAALLNLTAVLPSAGTYLTAYPCDEARPNASTINLPADDIRANGAIVKLSAAGTVCVYTVSGTDIVVDVNGYVPRASQVTTLNPARLLDTRPGEKTVDGVGAGAGRARPGSVVTLKVAGRAGVPADATGVFLNVTAVLPSADTFLRVFECDQGRTDTSTLNLRAGDIRANNAFAKVSASGTVCLYTVAETDIVVDVTGFVPSGVEQDVDVFTPRRALDTRDREGEGDDGTPPGSRRLKAGSTVSLTVDGPNKYGAYPQAAFLNLTSVSPSKPTFLTVYSCDDERPDASNLNLGAGEITANGVFVRLNTVGSVCVYSVADTDVIIDVAGTVSRGPGTVELHICDALDDVVVLKNEGGRPADLTRYTLYDNGENYIFPLSGTIRATGTQVFVSGSLRGEPDWRRLTKDEVWDDTGDTAHLVAPDGTVTTMKCTTKRPPIDPGPVETP